MLGSLFLVAFHQKRYDAATTRPVMTIIGMATVEAALLLVLPLMNTLPDTELPPVFPLLDPDKPLPAAPGQAVHVK